MKRSLLVLCVGLFLVGCGTDKPSPTTPPTAVKPPATEYVLPECDACLNEWRISSARLQRETQLTVVVLGKPKTLNGRIAAVTEWARMRGTAYQWVNTWFRTRATSTGTLEEQFVQAAKEFNLSGPSLEAAIKAGTPAAIQRYKAAKKQNIRTVPTLVLQDKSIAVLAGGWTAKQLDQAFVNIKKTSTPSP